MMDLEDLEELVRRCRDCASEFRITEDERAFFYRRGLSLPKRCKSCRAIRRAAGVSGPSPTDGSSGGQTAA